MVRLKKELKGGSKVKIKETEEEKLIRLEAAALQAEEAARQREETERLKMRERRAREEKYAKVNRVKIHCQWRKIMRMNKVDELRKEIEILSQNHEREVDRKDAIIQMLHRDLEDAEDQYQMALRGHMKIVDSLLNLQYIRIKSLREQLNRNISALDNEFNTEQTEIENHSNRQQKEMNDMMTAMEKEFDFNEADARQEFESHREEIKNRNSEEYNVLKISLESTIEDLEHHFEQAHQAYLNSTDARTQAFRKLTKNDAQSARVIEKRMRKLIRLQDSLAHWRTKITTNTREWTHRNKSLKTERDIMAKHYQRLKHTMNEFRRQQQQRLKSLSVNSGAAIKELESKLGVAEHILNLGELARKLETEMEKVLPFYTPNDALPEEKENTSTEVVSVEEDNKPKFSSYGVNTEGKEIDEWSYLNQFFKRQNKVNMDNMAIDKEKKRLDRENADLRSILKQYLDGISVNEDVINNPCNPLLVVNNKLQLAQQERAEQAQQQVVEVIQHSH